MYAAAMIQRNYIFNLREFLRLQPDLHLTDNEGKTAFEYFPDLRYGEKFPAKWLNCFLEYCETYDEKDWIIAQFKQRYAHDEKIQKQIDICSTEHETYLQRLGKEML
jgi:hypothetical protein